MRKAMLQPRGSDWSDSEDEKYGKRQGLSRRLGKAALYAKRNKEWLLKVAVAVLSTVLLLTLLKSSSSSPRLAGAVQQQQQQQAPVVEGELGQLGLPKISSTRQTQFAADDDVEEEDTEESAPATEDSNGISEREALELDDAQTDDIASTEDAASPELVVHDNDEDADAASSAEEANDEDEDEMTQSEEPPAARMIPPSNKPLTEMTNEELFENAKELEECGRITVPQFVRRQTNWHALRAYTKLYASDPIYACVPKLHRHLQLTVEEFTELFRKRGQPVLFYFDNLRKLGFNMRSFTIDELQEIFPFDPVKDKQIQYTANAKVTQEFLDLGPAIYNFKDDQKLVKNGAKRSFPRNMKVKPSALSKLGVQLPPLILNGEAGAYQSPSLWFGSSTSPTAFHSDCCDNFVLMLTGTKRFTLAPPTDWHNLTPHCIGKHKNLCYANVQDPSDPSANLAGLNVMSVDVNPGQVLYLPSGMFHHVANQGATLMTNVWTRSRETLGIISCNRN